MSDPRPVGDRGLLIELPDNSTVHAFARAAHQRFGDALEDVVPGHTTVLIVWGDARSLDAALMSDLKALIETASAFKSDTSATADRDAAAITVPVTYDGPDLERVAVELELSVDAVIELHTGTVFTVAFMGFAPGFPYLIAKGESDRQAEGGGAKAAALPALPRLATPRTEVPAGSVAVAAGYCGIYPRSSPGGWNLLGRTDAVLFDSARARPSTLEPGMAVRFVAR